MYPVVFVNDPCLFVIFVSDGGFVPLAFLLLVCKDDHLDKVASVWHTKYDNILTRF